MEFIYLFLIITFVLHAVAFTVLALRRRKTYYFWLTATFSLLTLIYLMKLEMWSGTVPGTRLPWTWLLRIGATLSTLIYLGMIYRVEGSWLWKLIHRRKPAP